MLSLSLTLSISLLVNEARFINFDNHFKEPKLHLTDYIYESPFVFHNFKHGFNDLFHSTFWGVGFFF